MSSKIQKSYSVTVSQSKDGQALHYYCLGMEEKSKSNFSCAQKHFQAAIAINGAYHEAYRRLGDISMLLNNYQEAKNYYQKVVLINPESYHANFYLGYILDQNLQTIEQSIKYYKKASQIVPNKFQALYQLGKIYHFQKKYPEALAYFNNVINLKPATNILYKVHYFKGVIYHYHLKDLQNAQICYRKSIQMEDKWIETYKSLGELYQLQNQFSKAQQLYQNFITLFPRCVWGYYQLGKIYQFLAQYQKADVMFNLALQRNPNCAKIVNRLGQVYFLQGKNIFAEKFFHKAFQLDNSLTKARYNLGVLHQKLTIYPKAQKQFQYCTLINPHKLKYAVAKVKNLALMERYQQIFALRQQKQGANVHKSNKSSSERIDFQTFFEMHRGQYQSEYDQFCRQVANIRDVLAQQYAKVQKMSQYQQQKLRKIFSEFIHQVKNISLEISCLCQKKFLTISKKIQQMKNKLEITNQK